MNDEAQALQSLRDILARPELQPTPVSPWAVLQQAILGWLRDLLLTATAHVRDAATGREGVLGVVLLALAVLVVVLVIVFLVRALRRQFVSDGPEEMVRARQRERSDQIWREAGEHAARGAYAEAVKALYLSALYALDERAVLPLHEGLTNHEHAARLLTAQPAVADPFGELVRGYDRLRYGGYEADAAAFARLRPLAERSRQAGGYVQSSLR